MIIIDGIKQGSIEWLKCRANKITSSRFGDLMKSGRNGKESETALTYIAQLTAEALLGEPLDTYKSKDMVWGNETEPQARAFYELARGVDVRQVSFIQHDNPLIGASPDGLVGNDGMVEIKCPKTHTQVKRFLNNTGLPDEYKYQVYGQLWVAEREWNDFVSFDPRLDTVAAFVPTRVYRDEIIIKPMAEKILNYADLLAESIEKASRPLEW